MNNYAELMVPGNRHVILENIENNVLTTINALRSNGSHYESELIYSKKHDPDYEFLFPESKYYKYYISMLSKHMNNQNYTIEGTIEDMSVGGMGEVVKNYMK